MRHLLLFGGYFFDRIKYIVSKKGGITNSIKHNFAGIKTDSCNSLPIKKILTFHNVIILIKSVVNENKNHYYYNVFLKVHIKINPMHNIFKWMFAYYKWHISIELKFLKELMLIRQANQKSVVLVTIGIF